MDLAVCAGERIDARIDWAREISSTRSWLSRDAFSVEKFNTRFDQQATHKYRPRVPHARSPQYIDLLALRPQSIDEFSRGPFETER